ncbi:MAG: SPFH domain-containing protein [Bacteroidota bacterium]
MNRLLSFTVAILSLSILSSCTTIYQGEVGVKRKRGIIDPVPILEGRTGVNPFNTVVFKIPTRTKNLRLTIPLPSKEGLTVDAEISIIYHLDPMAVPQLLKDVGMDFETQMIYPVFRSAASDVAARFYAKDLHSGERSIIEAEILEKMNTSVSKHGIIVDNVLMKSIELPSGLRRTIEQKLEAEQEAQRMQFVKQQEEADAERKIIEAKGEQQVAILKAEGEKQVAELKAEGQANATLTQAKADAEANKLLSESLTEEVLRLQAIEAVKNISTSPNSKLIVNPGGTPIWGLDPTTWTPEMRRSENRR